MKIINPYIEIWPFNPDAIMRNLELAARCAYKSEGNITNDSAGPFLQKIIKSGHESVLEHEKITVRFVVDRGISHELVRHRIASLTQESTRYCNYSGNKFGNEITVIRPFFFNDCRDVSSKQIPHTKLYNWRLACISSETLYFKLIELGATPQEARSVLPNSLKTEVVMTANIREWRHFLRLRCDKAAHPQMRQVAIPLLFLLKAQLPVLFGDIPFDQDFCPVNYADVRWRE